MNLAAEIIKLRVAAQVAPRRWQRGLEQLAKDLESGQQWPEALNELSVTAPELGSLLRAAGQAGQPAEITLDVIRQRNLGRAAWYRFLACLVYPVILLMTGLILASVVSLLLTSLLRDVRFEWSGVDQLTGRIQDLYHASMGGLIAVAWFAVFSSTIYAAGSPNARLKLVGSLPFVGRIYRWLAMSELLTRFSIFSRHQPVLESALLLTAESFGQGPLAAITKYVAERVAQGQAFQNALHSTIVSDARAGLALTIIQKESLGSSAGLAARLLERMVELACARLSLIVPPLILFAFASIVWGTWLAFVEVLNAFYRLLS